MLGKYPVEEVNGGVAVHIKNLVGSLGDIGGDRLDLHMISFGSRAATFKDGNSTIHILKIHKYYYLLPPLSILRIAYEVGKIKPDIIHVQGANVSPYLIFSLFFSPGIKKIATFHGDFVKEEIAERHFQYGSLRYYLYKWLEYSTIHKFDVLVSVSDYLKNCLVNEYGREASEKIAVVPNGADIVHFTPRPKEEARSALMIPNDQYIIFHAKGLYLNHGQTCLIKSLWKAREKIPNIKLYLAGDGPIRQKLIDLANELKISDSVILLGNIQNGMIPGYIAASDVVCVPTLSMYGMEEPSCIFLIEAMTMGKPCIATNTGGLPESITNDVNGILVPERDYERIASAIIKLYDDPDRARELGDNARSYVLKERSWDIIAEQLVGIYAKVAARSPYTTWNRKARLLLSYAVQWFIPFKLFLYMLVPFLCFFPMLD